MVSRRRRAAKRTVSLAVFAPFFFAMGLFGVSACPYHGRADTQSGPRVSAHPQEHLAHDESADQRPCTWLVDCNACVGAPLPGPDLYSSLLPTNLSEAAADPTPCDQGPLGPRRGLFELHLPNAPPRVV
jgi:hypothetical protein